MSRLYTGLNLAAFVVSCIYLQYVNILFFAMQLALIYDCLYLSLIQDVDIRVSVGVYLFFNSFYRSMSYVYHTNPAKSIFMITVVQVSDVLQYICGKYYGKNKIHYISKNKTFEGYILGMTSTVALFTPLYYYLFSGFFQIEGNVTLYLCQLYLQGILGGLISSSFKRKLMIKDYSDLLGDHGGWIDRIDSIVFPILFYLISENKR